MVNFMWGSMEFRYWNILSWLPLPLHADRYLDFNSSHPILAKRAVVRALMDRAENVCSDPDILAKEMEHLNRVLHYNNYPQWIINQWGKLNKQDPIIHPETGMEIKKHFYISVPYFPGLSESYKKICQVHSSTGLFQGGQHSQIHTNALKGQNLQWPKEGSSLPLGMQSRWV